MRKYMLGIAAVGLLMSPAAAFAASAAVTPVAESSIATEDAGLVTVLQFELPAAARQGKVLRAVLELAASKSGAEAVWVTPAVTAVGAGPGLTWWAAEKSAEEESAISSCDLVAGRSGPVLVDVTKWVRAWAGGTAANQGLVVRQVGPAGGVSAEESGEAPASATLRIVYRP